MEQVAGDWSEKVSLTSDNPRNEDPAAIIRDMENGVTPVNRRKTISIADRREAIKASWNLAGPGSIILLAGKGHEKYQEINRERVTLEDKEELQKQIGRASCRERGGQYV